jgi:hypothetical protein
MSVYFSTGRINIFKSDPKAQQVLVTRCGGDEIKPTGNSAAKEDNAKQKNSKALKTKYLAN